MDLEASDRSHWLGRQLQHLIHCRDNVYADDFGTRLAAIGIADVRMPYRSPLGNSVAERFTIHTTNSTQRGDFGAPAKSRASPRRIRFLLRVERELYFFEYVNRRGADLVAALENRTSSFFQAATESALEKTEQFKSRLNVDIAGFVVGRDVIIELGKPDDKGYAVYFPIKWHSASHSELFPSMEAEIEVVPLNDIRPLAQLSIIGRYRPPMNVFGVVGDAMLGHRIAESAVRNFITDLAAHLQAI